MRVLGAAAEYTTTKRNKSAIDDLCERAWGGLPAHCLGNNSGGWPQRPTVITLRSVNRLVAVNTNTPLGEVARRFWQRVSVDLQKANHRAFVKRAGHQGGCAVQSACVRFLKGWGASADEDMGVG